MTIIFWTAVWLFVALAFWTFMNLVLWDRARWRGTKIAARADYEHSAILRGDIMTGVYGGYPPAKL